MNPQLYAFIQQLQGMGFTPQQIAQILPQYLQQQQQQQMQQQYAQMMYPSQGQQLGMGLGGLAGIGSILPSYFMQLQAARNGMNPAAISRGIGQLTQPLSKNLINSVTRATAPGIAGSGLATAPGMSEQILGEAMAPYSLKEQELASQNYWAGQGMPFNVGSGMAGDLPYSLADFGYLMGGIR